MTESTGTGQSSVMPAASVPGTSGSSEFEQLFSEHYAFVWRSLVHFGLDPSTADDASQEVFLVVHRRLDEFDRSRPFRSWVYGIARRAASAHLRGRGRAAAREAAQDPPKPAPAPDDELQARQTADWVAQCLDAMPEEQREVFVLAEVEDMSAPEISELLGVKLNTVYSRLRLARERFNREHARASNDGGTE